MTASRRSWTGDSQTSSAFYCGDTNLHKITKMTILQVIISVAVLIAVSLSASRTFAAPSNLTRLVYYNQNATWDEAIEACGRFGGFLVHIEDDNKQAVVMETIQQLRGETVGHIWLGQIKPTIQDTSFVWTNKCTPVTYAKWGEGQPSADPTDQCVRVNMSSQTWEAVQCGQTAKIFCEYSSDDSCNYETHVQTGLQITTSHIASETFSTFGNFSDECQHMCDTLETTNSGECWAASFEGLGGGSNICNLYSSQERLTIQDESLMINAADSTLWFKKCHQGEERPPISLVSAGGEWNEYECETNSFWMRSLEECECPCHIMTEAESQRFMDDILSSLTINVSNLSSVRRRYYSVIENDVVTLGLGYSGVIFIVLALLLVILSDVDVLIRGRSSISKGQG